MSACLHEAHCSTFNDVQCGQPNRTDKSGQVMTQVYISLSGGCSSKTIAWVHDVTSLFQLARQGLPSLRQQRVSRHEPRGTVFSGQMEMCGLGWGQN